MRRGGGLRASVPEIGMRLEYPERARDPNPVLVQHHN